MQNHASDQRDLPNPSNRTDNGPAHVVLPTRNGFGISQAPQVRQVYGNHIHPPFTLVKQVQTRQCSPMSKSITTQRSWPVFASLFVLPLVLSAQTPSTNSGNTLRPWDDYRTIMWIGDAAGKDPSRLPLFKQRLEEMGINTAMVFGDASPEFWAANNFPYYVENVVNRGLCLKFSSRAADWEALVTAWARTRDTNSLVRDPSLDDPAWIDWSRKQVLNNARINQPFKPVAYDLRDEISITISANPFDYDFSPHALNAFRQWLKTQYPTLDALNQQWQTEFASWDAVLPFTTDQIKNRLASGDALPRGNPDWQAVQKIQLVLSDARRQPTRWNFSPWADFRTYMDLSLARTLDCLRTAIHTIDPGAPVGIEGTQMPSAFGGYDLWRMANALDWIEPYDIGSAREVLGSFMPGKPFLTTVFEKETHLASRRLWHLLLQGDKGCIIWWSEDCIDWKSPDYALTPRAKPLIPALKEMTGPLARLFMHAPRLHDPVAVLYSQPSIQADWLVESCVDGSTWLRRFSSYEAGHNRQVRVRESWLKLLQDSGYSPIFVASEQVEKGYLERQNIRALILPEALALSDVEGAQIQKFMTNGNGSRVAFSDGTPGVFDAHGRLRPRSPLEDYFPASLSSESAFAADASKSTTTKRREGDVAAYALDRLSAQPSPDWTRWLQSQMPFTPEIGVTAADDTGSNPHILVTRFQAGSAQLVSLERNIAYHMDESLKQAGGNERLEKPVRINVALKNKACVYDLRAETLLTTGKNFTVEIDPWKPTLLALSAEPLPKTNLVSCLSEKLR